MRNDNHNQAIIIKQVAMHNCYQGKELKNQHEHYCKIFSIYSFAICMM